MYTRIRYFAHWVVDGGWVLLLMLFFAVILPALAMWWDIGSAPPADEPRWWYPND